MNDNDLEINWLLLIPVVFAGVLGSLIGGIGFGDPLSGLIWGLVIGFTICVVSIIGYISWSYFERKINAGSLSAYLLAGFLSAVIICAYLAYNLGRPSCIESDQELRGGCVEYADDGYEASTSQKWAKFWNSLPTTTVITMLIAALIQSKSHRSN